MTEILSSIDRELLTACNLGQAKRVEHALAGGANPMTEGGDGITALMEAAWRGHADALRLLLRAGADANQKDRGREMTALMWAANYGQPECVEVLTPWSDPLAVDAEGWNALAHIAGSAREYGNEAKDACDLKVAMRLMEWRGLNVDARDQAGLSPLMRAIKTGRSEMARQIGQRCDPTKRGPKGKGLASQSALDFIEGYWMAVDDDLKAHLIACGEKRVLNSSARSAALQGRPKGL